jgi:hypothetical protein
MLRKLFGDDRGAISILSAVVIVGVIGFSALALEYGNGLLQQVEDQRIADLAAYSGALVYNSTGSNSSTSSAVNNMASLNGVTSTTANAKIGSSPTGDGNQAVQVTVQSSAPLLLGRVLTTNTSIPVSATAYVEINANAPGCIIALGSSTSSTNGIVLSGTGSLTADNCQIESNSVICPDPPKSNPSDVITTKYLSYDSGANPTTSNCTVSPPSGTASVHVSKASASDPLAGNSEVSGAVSRISTVASITSPVVSGGTAVTFGSSGITSGLPTGCMDTYASSTHSVACTGQTSYTFGAITVSGGITVNFTNGGTYYFASTTAACGKKGPTGESICNSGTALTIAGPSTFVLAGGIYNGGGASMALGSGSTSNSYDIGADSAGDSINVGTSQIMTFGDATGSGDVFETAGTITSGGGSCLALPAAAEHDINGDISSGGGMVLGSGIYTVNGYINFAGGGGDVSNCPTAGTTTGLTGLGVTLVVSGASTTTCNSLASAFCLGSGFDTVKLTAPTSTSTLGTSTAGLAVIGPQSSSANPTAAASFSNGASNTQVSGAFYFPNGQIYMSGSATLQDTVDSSACLELIGTQVTATAGTAVGSTCVGLGSGSAGTTIGLVQ